MAQFEESLRSPGVILRDFESRRIRRAQPPHLPEPRTCFTPDASRAQHDALNSEPNLRVSRYQTALPSLRSGQGNEFPGMGFRIPARSNPAQFFFWFRFLAQYWFRFDHDFLTQSVEQRIKDNFEGLRVLGQHAFHAFAMHRQFSDGPRAAEVNPAG